MIYEIERNKKLLEYKIQEIIYLEVYFACRLKFISKNKDKFLDIKENEEIKVKYSFNNKG